VQGNEGEASMYPLWWQGTLHVHLPQARSSRSEALAKTTNLKKLEQHLLSGDALRLQKLGKNRRTLKKASGKRGFSEAFKVTSRKSQKSSKAARRNKKREKDRRPRAKK